jgi:hypothetical protein
LIFNSKSRLRRFRRFYTPLEPSKEWKQEYETIVTRLVFCIIAIVLAAACRGGAGAVYHSHNIAPAA